MNENSTRRRSGAVRTRIQEQTPSHPPMELLAGGLGDSETPITTWESLNRMVRLKVQAFIQQVLEEEVTVLLGRRSPSEDCLSVSVLSAVHLVYPRRIAHTPSPRDVSEGMDTASPGSSP